MAAMHLGFSSLIPWCLGQSFVCPIFLHLPQIGTDFWSVFLEYFEDESSFHLGLGSSALFPGGNVLPWLVVVVVVCEVCGACSGHQAVSVTMVWYYGVISDREEPHRPSR